MAEMPDVAMMQ